VVPVAVAKLLMPTRHSTRATPVSSSAVPVTVITVLEKELLAAGVLKATVGGAKSGAP
jgi:hypothetical protein